MSACTKCSITMQCQDWRLCTGCSRIFHTWDGSSCACRKTPTINGARYDFSRVDIKIDTADLRRKKASWTALQEAIHAVQVMGCGGRVPREDCGAIADDAQRELNSFDNSHASYAAGYYACLQDLGMVPKEKR